MKSKLHKMKETAATRSAQNAEREMQIVAIAQAFGESDRDALLGRLKQDEDIEHTLLQLHMDFLLLTGSEELSMGRKPNRSPFQGYTIEELLTIPRDLSILLEEGSMDKWHILAYYARATLRIISGSNHPLFRSRLLNDKSIRAAVSYVRLWMLEEYPEHIQQWVSRTI